MKNLLPLIIMFLAYSSATAQITPGVGAGTEDPKIILAAADRAVSKIHNVSYTADYEGSGAFATRASVVSGKVRLEKLPAGDPMTARIMAQGDHFQAGESAAEKFSVAFDGKTIFRLRLDKKHVARRAISDVDPRERDFGYVTGRLGGGAYRLLMFEYILPAPFAKHLSDATLEYEGRTVVGGVACHVVYAESVRQKHRWYIGIADDLPRRLEELAADDKGRTGAYVLTLRDVRVNLPGNINAFKIAPPKGFVLRDYEEPKVVLSPLKVGSIAPAWTLFNAAGTKHYSSEYRGQIVLLDFWATWCGPCVRFMPAIQALHEKFRDRGVTVFGVNAWEESNSVAYFNEKGYNYGLLLKGESVARSYNVTLLPHIYVIGTGGRIIFEGIEPDENLIAAIEKHLRENGK